MCGIFLMLNNGLEMGQTVFSKGFIQDAFERGSRRGPESSKLIYPMSQIIAGFHRLAINGLDDLSMQPIWINNKMLICNGEIYNYKKLYEQLGVAPTTNSDCEIILHLYDRVGIDQTIRMLDGVFAFAIYDANLNQVFIARDPYGVRPLYYWRGTNNIFMFASELKVIAPFQRQQQEIQQQQQQQQQQYSEQNDLIQFPPGHYQIIVCHKFFKTWMRNETRQYHTLSTFSSYLKPISIHENIVYYLNNAVMKRCLATDRPIACLLSGGLDSSLIAALVNNFYSLSFDNKLKLETYSIGLADSEDLKYARIVADHLGTNHTEIIMTEDDFFKAIPYVIEAIESYDTTTVRASIGNYLIGKYISEHSEAKVIFNGDGSDELCGGYLYMHKCPNTIEFDNETKRLLNDIYMFDVLRSDKCISSHGLEPRTPFLDKSFVQYYLSIPAEERCHPMHGQCEKHLLRSSFETMYHPDSEKPFLPANILWRTKEAFSDGVSGHGRSLYHILQEKIAQIEGIEEEYSREYESKYKYKHLPPMTLEQYYYRRLFDGFYPNNEKMVPYFWMPKYTSSNDPSARTLTTLYNAKMNI
jgi:asparagine synthase (glutamine-hydrolysing)